MHLNISLKNVRPRLLWDRKGVILEYYMDRRETMTNAT